MKVLPALMLVMAIVFWVEIATAAQSRYIVVNGAVLTPNQMAQFDAYFPLANDVLRRIASTLGLWTQRYSIPVEGLDLVHKLCRVNQ